MFGEGATLTVMEVMSEHDPMKAVTEYEVVADGVTIILEVVAPVLQR